MSFLNKIANPKAPAHKQMTYKKLLYVYGAMTAAAIGACGYCAQPPSPEEVAEKEAQKKEEAVQKEIREEKCKRELDCVASATVRVACEAFVPKLAKNSMRWANADGTELGMFTNKFEHSKVTGYTCPDGKKSGAPFTLECNPPIDWHNAEARATLQISSIRLWGDKAQFQTGFGAWKNVVYYCDVDVVNQRIVDAGLLSE